MTRRRDTRRPRQREWQIARIVFARYFFLSRSEEAGIVSKRSVLTTALVIVAGAFFAPVYAQEAVKLADSNPDVARWSIITAGFALAFAAGLAALAQGRAVAS